MTEKSPDTHLDGVLRALADGDRRRALYFLGEHGSVTRAELADVLTGWRTVEEGVDVVGPDDRERTAVALRHLHLPVLAEADLVEYDDETVVPATVPPWVEECLGIAFDADRSIDAQAAPADGREDWRP